MSSYQSEDEKHSRDETQNRHSVSSSNSGDKADETTKSDTKKHQKEKHSKSHQINICVDAFVNTLELSVDQHITGRELFDQVAHLLKLKEVWFFGIQFKDPKGMAIWLKLKKKLLAQDVGKKRPIHIKFRAKFYPEDVAKELTHSVSQRIFYEQVKLQILNGDVYCPIDTAVLLASYSLQEKNGNYNAILQPKGFLEEEDVLPRGSTDQYDLTHQQWEDKIVTFYKDHRDMNKEQAMMEYLKIAQDLEMFGVDFFAIKNKKGTDLYLGVDSLGLNVYETENKLAPKMGFPWDEILSISFKDKRFTINPIDTKAPNFVFLATKSRVNKKILALCMGNHELFIRRRKTHVAPSQRSSRSSSARTSNAQVSAHVEPRFSRTDTGPYEVISPVLQNGKDDSYPEDYQSDLNEHAVPADIHANLRRTRTPSPQYQEDDVRETSPARSTSPKNKKKSVQYNSVTAEDNAFLYEQIATLPVERHSRVHSESSDVPESPTFSPVVDKHDGKSLFDVTATSDHGNGEMAEYATVLPRNKGVVKEDDVPERRLYMPQNRRTYQRLVELFEEMSQSQTTLSPEDRYYLELKASGADKYKTWKHIRSGYAKDRVALFEAL